MADFAEYLPVDTRLANGVDGRLMHNAWPTLWAELNASAIAEAGAQADTTFFNAGWLHRHATPLRAALGR